VHLRHRACPDWCDEKDNRESQDLADLNH